MPRASGATRIAAAFCWGTADLKGGLEPDQRLGVFFSLAGVFVLLYGGG